MFKYPIYVLSFVTIFLSSQFEISYSDGKEKEIIRTGILPITDYSSLKDTVYTLKSYFIEVDISKQIGYLHSRTEPVKEFGVSTGNPKLSRSIETNDGIFVIQSMMKRWHSRQFDSTLMLNWMGFNYGIGFHALAGNSYYKYLGEKKSSHGCVRISKEDAVEIYSKIELGTPVLVHNGNNAVTIGFADSSDNFLEYSFNELTPILTDRYEKIYDGKYFLNTFEKILIDRNNVYHPGLPIGNSENIPSKQLILPESFQFVYSHQDGVKVNFSGIL